MSESHLPICPTSVIVVLILRHVEPLIQDTNILSQSPNTHD